MPDDGIVRAPWLPLRLLLSCGIVCADPLQGRDLLPRKLYPAATVSGGSVLRPNGVPCYLVQVRLQVPGGIVRAHPVPIALLLPGVEELGPDTLPARAQVRPAGHVQADSVPAGNVRVVRGQEVVRQVLQGALLPHADVVGAVSGGVLLPRGGVCAEAVPGGQVLPGGVVQAQRLPGGQAEGGGEGLRLKGPRLTG